MTKRYESAPPTQPKIELERIPQGYPGTQRTLRSMQALIRQGVKDFYVRQKAIDILLEKGVRPKDYLGEIKALFEWVQQNVRYTKDAFRLEILHTARRMLELRAGDCDDMSILLGAMLEAIGHPVRLVIVGPDPFRPDLFTHVYLEAYYKGRWIPLDATMPHPMGWAPRAFNRSVIPMARRPEASLQSTGRPCAATNDGQIRRNLNVVQLGELVGLIYRTDRWRPGRPRTYIHFMEDRPKLVSNSAGTQLYLIGGSYRLTPHGIQG